MARKDPNSPLNIRNHLRESVAYFYCKYEDDQRNTFVAVAKAIISQILVQNTSLVPYLYERASRSGTITLNTIKLAKELLKISMMHCEKLLIVIDGLDECSRDNQKDIASEYQAIVDSMPVSDAGRIRCLFVCQNNSTARKDLGMIPCLHVDASNNKQDIATYVSIWTKRMQGKFSLSDEEVIRIDGMITQKADGMLIFNG
jgi:hypothetical protein